MKMSWFILSLIALLSFSAMSFLITLLTRKGYPVSLVLLGIAIVLLIFYSFKTFVLSSERPQLTFGVASLILLIGLLSAIGNLASYRAATDAPNPGLALAIVALSSGVVTLLAFFIFKDKLTTLQIVGLALALTSIVLIVLGSNKGKDKLSVKNNLVSTEVSPLTPAIP